MSNNSNNSNSSNNDVLPKHLLNYIHYELSYFEKLSNKKFLFSRLRNERFELNVSKSKELKENDSNEARYQLIYSANNLYQFIKKLLMIREYIIKNFDNNR